MSTEMDSFLGTEGGAAVVDPPEVPAAAADPPAAAADADPAPTPPADPPAAEEPPEDIPEDVRGLLNALTATRGQRNDHKGRADRLEGELTATKAALEAASKAPPAAAVTPAVIPIPAADTPPATPPVPRQVPNPVEDPQGFARYHAEQLFNTALNLSESSLRRAVKNDADVDAKVAAFKGAVAANPSLYQRMRQQPDPYQFVYDEGAKILAVNEIGTDPAAYRARVEAEIRATIAAEASGIATPVPAPQLTLPRSLAGASSSAPRMQAVEQPMEFGQIFEPRKRA